ncbi:MAG TPA: PfkB family carbohydrate kinase [bacterium]|nr:PfkB family carbohydrate kinase [bacterium]
MSILVVGSVAYDNLETPCGRREEVLGGAATHFSTAASFFTDVHLVGVVGGDFSSEHMEFLRGRGIGLAGLKVIGEGKTFRWSGHYLNDLNCAETLDTQLGVFGTFDPTLDDHHRDRPYLFLANIHPSLQLKVLSQMNRPKLIAMDTMNLWINTQRDELQKVIERVDMVFVNDGEARLLTGEGNVTKAAGKIMSWGPRCVVVKRGEYGALLFTDGATFAAPALPLSEVVDPTGAGDTFAGGFMGCVARNGNLSEAVLRRAVVCGSVMASFQVEDFGLDRLRRLSQEEIDSRFSMFRDLSSFECNPIF